VDYFFYESTVSQFCADDTAFIFCLSCRKGALINRRFYFELNNKII
jgi:hypothetical protein